MDLFQIFNGALLSAVGDVPADNEVTVVTSSISRFVSPTWFFEMLIGVGYAYRDECTLVYASVCICESRKKIHNKENCFNS